MVILQSLKGYVTGAIHVFTLWRNPLAQPSSSVIELNGFKRRGFDAADLVGAAVSTVAQEAVDQADA